MAQLRNLHIEPFSHLAYARAERFELPSTVLETAILPLNYARKGPSKPPQGKAF